MLQIRFFYFMAWLFFNVANISQNPGQNTYASSVGFLSNSIDALRLVMSSVLSTQPWLRDPEVVTIPWREALVQSTLSRASIDGSSNNTLPLKLGIYWTDGVVVLEWRFIDSSS
jgi:amidase